MGNIANHMFVGTDTSRQDFRDRRVGNSRETKVDTSQGIGIPLIGHITQRHSKGKGPILVVNQMLSELSGSNPTKGGAHTDSKAGGKDR